MKRLFTGLCMCWGNFCFIPGLKKWDENARSLMLGWLPTIGFAIGIIWMAVYFGLVYLSFPFLAASFIMMWIPFILSGFIHVDGFMDVSDALLSRGTLEKKRAILKDSNTGAMAVTCFVFVVLAWYSFMSTAISQQVDLINLLAIVVIPRAVSGLFVLNSKPMETSQYAEMHMSDTESDDIYDEADENVPDDIDEECAELEMTEDGLAAEFTDDFDEETEEETLQKEETSEESAEEKASSIRSGNIILIVQLVVYLAVMAVFCKYYLSTGIVAAAAALGTMISVLIAKKELKGMNGDIAGYGIVWGELMGVFGLIFI